MKMPENMRKHIPHLNRNADNISVIMRHFTLIELLVVIAIIAILAALLLPALAKAKQMVTRIQCTANQKSIAMSLFNYSDSNNNYLPFVLGYAGRPVLHGLITGADPNAPDNNGHLIKQKFLVCPGRKPMSDYMKNFPYRFAYLLDRDRWKINNSEGLKIHAVKNTTQKLLSMDHSDFGLNHYYRNISTWAGTSAYLPGTGTSEPVILAKKTPDINSDFDFMQGRHGNSVVIVYLDGHAESKASAAITPIYYTRPGNNGSGDMFDITK